MHIWTLYLAVPRLFVSFLGSICWDPATCVTSYFTRVLAHALRAVIVTRTRVCIFILVGTLYLAVVRLFVCFLGSIWCHPAACVTSSFGWSPGLGLGLTSCCTRGPGWTRVNPACVLGLGLTRIHICTISLSECPTTECFFPWFHRLIHNFSG